MSSSGKIVLVTGASGFIGSHICESYLEQGHQVCGLDNFSTGFRGNAAALKIRFPKTFVFKECDVSDPRSFEHIGSNGLDYVFHFASPASPAFFETLSLETLSVNSNGLFNALEVARKYDARVVFASTSEVYGDPHVNPQPETYYGNVNSFGVRSCYDEAKRFGEALLFSYNQRYGARHGLVRIFNTYGPRMNPEDGRVIVNFVARALKKDKIQIYGDGSQTRSFCYVDDLVRAIRLYGENESLHEPVNIGNDREFTILELAKVVLELYNPGGGIEFLPGTQDDPRKRRPDLSKARRLLSSWEPKVPLHEGLHRTATWLQEIGFIETERPAELADL